jgi:hypothetical protein
VLCVAVTMAVTSHADEPLPSEAEEDPPATTEEASPADVAAPTENETTPDAARSDDEAPASAASAERPPAAPPEASAPRIAASAQATSARALRSRWDPASARPAPEQCREGCREHGVCDLVDDDCVATSSADCRASEGCRSDGECMFNRQKGRCDDGTERKSVGAVIAGSVMMGVGGFAALFGVGVVYFFCQGGSSAKSDCDDVPPATYALFAGGGAMLLGGIPLLVWGNSREPRDAQSAAPAVLVGPRAASLRWEW